MEDVKRIEAERRKIGEAARKIKDPNERARFMEREDEPLRLRLTNHYAGQETAHAQARAIARQQERMFQQHGTTFAHKVR